MYSTKLREKFISIPPPDLPSAEALLKKSKVVMKMKRLWTSAVITYQDKFLTVRIELNMPAL